MSSSWLINLEAQAKEKLTREIYDFVAGGAGNEESLDNNLKAYSNYSVIPRVLRNASRIDCSLNLTGTKLFSPIIIAPMAPHKLLHERGEIETVTAASKTNSLMIVSCMASQSSLEISKESSEALWFQLHIFKDRTITLNLAKKVESQGYKALIITVDMPVVGNRERNRNNKFKIPGNMLAQNLIEEGLISRKYKNSLNTLSMNELFDSSITWQDICWLKNNTSLPIYLKGVLHPQDAIKALEIGIDGIILSNHGARQLDCCVSPLFMLSKIRKILGNKFPIIVDGGIRSGSDVFKALAMGASSVLVGRPILWGLAVGGSYGVSGVLNRLNSELKQVMVLCGVSNLLEITEYGQSMLFKL
ncbi:alpha-hydroxy acid oxidase [Marinomonas sp. TI.3.20]|uniref:alpha-hydroxy acid oxidase n=1 Tax=Marinomonas sp. TI.3.20 TaxID=3121296 RepID=UPI00311D46DA